MIPKVKRLVDKQAYEDSRQERCENPFCRSMTSGGSHHIITRGASGPDHRFNLISLCVVCHSKAHAGNISKEYLFLIVSEREGVSVEEIVDTINKIRRGE